MSLRRVTNVDVEACVRQNSLLVKPRVSAEMRERECCQSEGQLEESRNGRGERDFCRWERQLEEIENGRRMYTITCVVRYEAENDRKMNSRGHLMATKRPLNVS